MSQTHKHGTEQQDKGHNTLPLSALLSHVQVAFTIELDNEFEQRMSHRTTWHTPTPDATHTPWLGSLVMWYNCLRFVDQNGITVSQLRRQARTETNLDGMRRWGYIRIEPDTSKSRSKQPRSDSLLYATPAGQKARAVWQPLLGEIEARWRERFGEQDINRLQAALSAIVPHLDHELPDCLPILGYGLCCKGRVLDESATADAEGDHEQQLQYIPSNHTAEPSLYSLLSRVLLAFALEFEQEANVSLAISANVLRILHEQAVPLRELPHLSGVSKEAISMAMTTLRKRSLVIIEADPAGSRFNVVRLTNSGLKERARYFQLLDSIEQRWHERFGAELIASTRAALERLVGVPTPQQSPLFQGLKPYPDSWRAKVRTPETLPYFPMILHRGGFPDGS
jgi:DNA-binding MarR family transcriptional regulator